MPPRPWLHNQFSSSHFSSQQNKKPSLIVNNASTNKQTRQLPYYNSQATTQMTAPSSISNTTHQTLIPPQSYHICNHDGYLMDIKRLTITYSSAPNLRNFLSCCIRCYLRARTRMRPTHQHHLRKIIISPPQQHCETAHYLCATPLCTVTRHEKGEMEQAVPPFAPATPRTIL